MVQVRLKYFGGEFCFAKDFLQLLSLILQMKSKTVSRFWILESVWSGLIQRAHCPDPLGLLLAI